MLNLSRRLFDVCAVYMHACFFRDFVLDLRFNRLDPVSICILGIYPQYLYFRSVSRAVKFTVKLVSSTQLSHLNFLRQILLLFLEAL